MVRVQWRGVGPTRVRQRAIVGLIVGCGMAIASCSSSGGARPQEPTDTVAPGEPVVFVEAARFGRGRAVAAATDGRTVVIGTTVGVVTRAAGTESVTELPTSLDIPIADVALAGDGRSTLLRDSTGAAELWALGDAPELLATLSGVESADFTDDGALLLVATRTTLARLSTADGSTVATGELATGDEIITVGWDTANGQGLAVSGREDRSTASWWTGATDLLPVDIDQPTEIERVAVDASRGRVLVASSIPGERFEGRLGAWDIATSNERFSTRTRTVAGSMEWALGVDGRVLAVDGSDLRLIDVDGTTVATWTRRSTTSVTEIVERRNSSGFAVVDAAGSISLVDSDGAETAVLASSGRPLADVGEFAGSPGIVSVDNAGRIRLWGDDGELLAAVDEYHAGGVREVDVSATGEMIGFGTSVGNAGVLRIGDGVGSPGTEPVDLPTDLAQSEGNIDTVRFTNDDAALLTGVSERNGDLSFDDTQTRWDLAGRTRTFVVNGIVLRVMGCVSFFNTIRVTPDGERFVAPFHDFTVSLRSVDDGSLIHEFPAHSSSVLDLVISPDGTRLVTTADDWTLRVWNLDDYTLESEYETAPGGYRSIAFLADATSLVTADISGALRVLDLETGSLSQPFAGEVGADGRIEVSPDGRYVAAGSQEGTIGLWSLATGELVSTVEAHEGLVTTVSFVPDGSQLVSGSADGTIKLWDLVAGMTG